MKKIILFSLIIAGLLSCKKNDGNTTGSTTTPVTYSATQKKLCAHIWIWYEYPDYSSTGSPIYKAGMGEVYRFNLDGTWSVLGTVASPYTGVGYVLDTIKPSATWTYSILNDTILKANGLGSGTRYISLLSDSYFFMTSPGWSRSNHCRAWK